MKIPDLLLMSEEDIKKFLDSFDNVLMDCDGKSKKNLFRPENAFFLM